jgi:hypothetical protein
MRLMRSASRSCITACRTYRGRLLHNHGQRPWPEPDAQDSCAAINTYRLCYVHMQLLWCAVMCCAPSSWPPQPLALPGYAQSHGEPPQPSHDAPSPCKQTITGTHLTI